MTMRELAGVFLCALIFIVTTLVSSGGIMMGLATGQWLPVGVGCLAFAAGTTSIIFLATR